MNKIIYSVFSGGKDYKNSTSSEKRNVDEVINYLEDFAIHLQKTRLSREKPSIVKRDVLYECLPSMYSGKFDSEKIESQYLFGSPLFKKYQEIENEVDNFMENPLEVQEGVFTCSRCKDNKTVSFELQTRSADEAATVYIQCVGCRKKWKA